MFHDTILKVVMLINNKLLIHEPIRTSQALELRDSAVGINR